MTLTSDTRYEPATESDCKHHWVIASPSGPTSEGRCKHCGAIRSFSNSLETALEESMKTAGVEEPAASHRWR